MARGPRDAHPGDITHVFNRGNNKKDIFLDEKDYLRFLQTVERAVERFKCKVYSFCLLPNHYHLLIQTGAIDISRVMHWIQTSYAMYFNKRHGHTGHLFQGRFGSSTCRDDWYFLQLLCYINLNAVNHGYAKDPLQWRWSSHQSLLEGVGPRFMDVATPLSRFAPEPKIAASRYARLIADGMKRRCDAPDPVEVAMMQRKSHTKEEYHEPAKVVSPPELEELAHAVCAEIGLAPEDLRNRERSDAAAAARGLLAARAFAAGHRSAHIAAFLKRSPSMVSWYLDAAGLPSVLPLASPNFLGPGP